MIYKRFLQLNNQAHINHSLTSSVEHELQAIWAGIVYVLNVDLL